MRRTNARRHGAAVALAATALIIAACGDSDSGDETPGTAGTDTTTTTAPSTTAPATASTTAGDATHTEDMDDVEVTGDAADDAADDIDDGADSGGDDDHGTSGADGAAGDAATGEGVGPVVELTVGEEPTRHSVSVGDEVMVVVTGDVADEIHVHGYDLLVDLVPGEPATTTFTADIPGVFEIELHDAGTLLAELEVQ